MVLEQKQELSRKRKIVKIKVKKSIDSSQITNKRKLAIKYEQSRKNNEKRILHSLELKKLDQNDNNDNVNDKLIDGISDYLKHYCSSSAGCLAFGLENEKIKILFDQFNDFKYGDKLVNKVGSKSVNGFQYQIDYSYLDKSKSQYKVTSLLKSTNNAMADNLYYEYLVGQYLNEMNLRFPCFTETYHLYLNESPIFKKEMMTNKTVRINDIKKHFKIQDKKMDISIACSKSDMLAILVQYIPNAQTFKSYFVDFKSVGVDEFYSTELIQLLFQIYAPLSQINKTYTHYDLHLSNVLFYPLGELEDDLEEQYINIKYVYKKSDIVVIKTSILAKIIDYGRSYFPNAPDVFKKVLEEKECEFDDKPINPKISKKKGIVQKIMNKTKKLYTTILRKKKKVLKKIV